LGFDAPTAVGAGAALVFAAGVPAAFALADAAGALALAALPVGAFSPPEPQPAKSEAERSVKSNVKGRTLDGRSIKGLPFECRGLFGAVDL
jgi:hypothetical protein